MVSSVLGVDLNEQTERVDSKILPVIATGTVDKSSDGLPRLLYQSVVWVDAGDSSNALIRNGCTYVYILYMCVLEYTCTIIWCR